MKNSKGLLALIIVASVIIIDQLLKIWVKTSFYYGESYPIASWFQLVFIENNGMAFGWDFINKIVLTSFRIIASVLFVYYIIKIKDKDIPLGYIVCVSLITAGTIGNTIDCVFYGVLFNNPVPPEMATMFAPEGGYSVLFEGRVVDMLYFPIAEWNWPDWVPLIGGDHFSFFQPIFNVADAALSVAVVVVIFFYSKYLTTSLKPAQNSSNGTIENITK